MKLSVIIVNYNVEHFLEQCLLSLRKATRNVSAEIIVVDNNSVDGSVNMVRDKFPEVSIIANKDNPGFSKANNQGIQLAKGEYILLLNPDTVVEETTLEKCVAFMDRTPDAGGLGVKMLDGKGNFLPESKRGLPTPVVAFYKIFGLSRLFPRSKRFNRYHLGYLDDNKTHEIEVLSGAYMFLRKAALDKTGLLDEDFFMYGEDIDLSYRLIKAGYKNYYFPETRIIHYKGESTKKGSVNYVFVFYNAMIIFAKKHFSQKNAQTFSLLINIAIYLRAFVAIMNRVVRKTIHPVLDSLLIFAGLYLIRDYWEHTIKFSQGVIYPSYYTTTVIPAYIAVWLGSVFLNGGYDKPYSLFRAARGIAAGTGVILIIYALLPESYRFSRALILLGSGWSLVGVTGVRLFLHASGVKELRLATKKEKKFLIIGSKEESKRVYDLLKETTVKPEFVGFVNPDPQGKSDPFYTGNLSQVEEMFRIYGINELIFCGKDLTSNQIIDLMSKEWSRNTDFKIAPPESLFVIGSNSIHTNGELYGVNINAINRGNNRRSKRLFDLAVTTSFIATLPIGLLFVKNRQGFIKNCMNVLTGNRSWVGYYSNGSNENPKLPGLKPGVLSPADLLANAPSNTDTIEKLNVIYARDYKVTKDLFILVKNLRETGRGGF